MIPKVRTWKVTVVETGKVYLIDTINKRFARMLAASEFGLWGKEMKISLYKEPKNYSPFEDPPEYHESFV